MSEQKPATEETPSPPKEEQPEIDIKALSLNEKYSIILTQVKQNGVNFFAQVNPSMFALPERDPLNLIWVNILTGWTLASTVLSSFEKSMAFSPLLAGEETDSNNKETKSDANLKGTSKEEQEETVKEEDQEEDTTGGTSTTDVQET